MSMPERIRRCPICGKPPTEASRPFCSTRCAQRDLGKWLSGDYAIPAEPTPDEDPESRQ